MQQGAAVPQPRILGGKKVQIDILNAQGKATAKVTGTARDVAGRRSGPIRLILGHCVSCKRPVSNVLIGEAKEGKTLCPHFAH